MEKKTLGSFIAALRKANGMTQKQLAEKLCVSDKAVSRWERDENLPDLSLIPVIAEIFGVTSDELLRGQRMNPEAPVTPSAEERTEQQRRRILKNGKLRFQTQSLICFGVGLVGVIAALICNFAFFRSYLGFGIGAALLLIAGLLLAVFTLQAWNAADEKDCEAELLQGYRTAIFDTCRHTATALVVLLAMTLPLLFSGDAYWGIWFSDWLTIAAVFSAVALLICFTIGQLLIHRMTADSELPQDKTRRQRSGLKLRALGKAVALILVIALLQVFVNNQLSTLFRKGTAYDNWDSFKTFMETEDNREFFAEGGSMITVIPSPDEIYEQEPDTVETVCDDNGKVLCEYIPRNRTVSHIQFAATDSRLPVTVYTYEDLAQQQISLHKINTLFIALYAIAAVLCLADYSKKAKQLSSH